MSCTLCAGTHPQLPESAVEPPYDESDGPPEVPRAVTMFGQWLMQTLNSEAMMSVEKSSPCMNESSPEESTCRLPAVTMEPDEEDGGQSKPSSEGAPAMSSSSSTTSSHASAGCDLWIHMLTCRSTQCPDARCRAAKRLLRHRLTCQVIILRKCTSPTPPEILPMLSWISN